MSVSVKKKKLETRFWHDREQNETLFTWYQQKVELLKTWMRVQ
jgi:hypothetical protein